MVQSILRYTGLYGPDIQNGEKILARFNSDQSALDTRGHCAEKKPLETKCFNPAHSATI